MFQFGEHLQLYKHVLNVVRAAFSQYMKIFTCKYRNLDLRTFIKICPFGKYTP